MSLFEIVPLVCLFLALLPLGMMAWNGGLLARPDPEVPSPSVTVLVPARNEQANISGCVQSCLDSVDARVRVVVGDDGSTDGTARTVEGLASSDPRIRLLTIPPLPPGWNGKQHACASLAAACDTDLMLFLDADVRLKPDGIARLTRRMFASGAGMVSGVPEQIVVTPWERLIVPMINTLLLGYLPILLMRKSLSPGFGAACGQMVLVRRDAYEASGGHDAIRSSLHDGLKLPRAFRRSGYLTDLIEGSEAAVCRMYDGGREVREGFMKNATEGMAKPVALPVWTVLLIGGHVLAWPLLAWAVIRGEWIGAIIAAAAIAASLLSRCLQAWRCREAPSAVLLHSIAVLLAVGLQWRALFRHWRGKPASWRGRSYVTHE